MTYVSEDVSLDETLHKHSVIERLHELTQLSGRHHLQLTPLLCRRPVVVSYQRLVQISAATRHTENMQVSK